MVNGDAPVTAMPPALEGKAKIYENGHGRTPSLIGRASHAAGEIIGESYGELVYSLLEEGSAVGSACTWRASSWSDACQRRARRPCSCRSSTAPRTSWRRHIRQQARLEGAMTPSRPTPSTIGVGLAGAHRPRMPPPRKRAGHDEVGAGDRRFVPLSRDGASLRRHSPTLGFGRHRPPSEFLLPALTRPLHWGFQAISQRWPSGS